MKTKVKISLKMLTGQRSILHKAIYRNWADVVVISAALLVCNFVYNCIGFIWNLSSSVYQSSGNPVAVQCDHEICILQMSSLFSYIVFLFSPNFQESLLKPDNIPLMNDLLAAAVKTGVELIENCVRNSVKVGMANVNRTDIPV
jgi:hypothetical protein